MFAIKDGTWSCNSGSPGVVLCAASTRMNWRNLRIDCRLRETARNKLESWFRPLFVLNFLWFSYLLMGKSLLQNSSSLSFTILPKVRRSGSVPSRSCCCSSWVFSKPIRGFAWWRLWIKGTRVGVEVSWRLFIFRHEVQDVVGTHFLNGVLTR